MSDLKICRICLQTQTKVYIYYKHQLKYFYEEIMALKVNDEDGLPHYFCYECAALLHKFHKFKEKCSIGQKTLNEIKRREPITYEAVYKIDRNNKNLKSSLQIMTVTERVKTYISKENLDKKRIENVVIEDVLTFEDFDDDQDMDVDPVEDPIAETEEFSDMQEGIEEMKEHIVNNEENLKQDDEEIIKKKELMLKLNEQNIGIEKMTMLETLLTHGKPAVNDNNIHNTSLETIPDYDSKKAKIISEISTDDSKKAEIISETSLNDSNEVEIISDDAKEQKKVTREPYRHRSRATYQKIVDSKNWKKYSMSEDDALAEFRSKAEDTKYIEARYKCEDCYKWFSREDMLTRHVKLKHDESLGNRVCKFCKMRFGKDCALRIHMRQHYSKFKCLTCNQVFHSLIGATFHEESHSGNEKKCLYCDKKFKITTTYYTHLRTHKTDFVCTLCGVSFVSSAGLNLHKQVKHLPGDFESIDSSKTFDTYCEKCDIRFPTRQAYDNHLVHSAKHSEKIVDSNGRTCVREKKPITCRQCGLHFETRSACMKHHSSEHAGVSFNPATKRHICELCGASLAPGSVSKHNNMHSRNKLYSCVTCGRAFTSSSTLKTHLVTHTGEKPFACESCDKRFTQSSSLRQHYKLFHPKQLPPRRWSMRRSKKDEPHTSETSQTEDNSNPSTGSY